MRAPMWHSELATRLYQLDVSPLVDAELHQLIIDSNGGVLPEGSGPFALLRKDDSVSGIDKFTVDLFLKIGEELERWGINPRTARFDPHGTLIRETTLVPPTAGDVLKKMGDRSGEAIDRIISTGRAAETIQSMSASNEAMDADAAAPISEVSQHELRRCNVPYSDVLHDDFLDAILWVEDTIGLRARNLVPCMAFETGGTFDPGERNPGSSATGLIQFMDATARRLGTTTTELAKMSQVRQMNYVFKYFRAFGNDLSHWDICDTYMAILYPVAIGKLGEFPVFVNGKGPNYAPNRGLDTNRDGTVTKAECCVRITEMLERGLKQQRRF